MDADSFTALTDVLALRREHNQWTSTGMIRWQAERWHARLQGRVPMVRCVEAVARLAGYASLEPFASAEVREQRAQAQEAETIEATSAWLMRHRDAELATALSCPPSKPRSFSLDTLPPTLVRWFHDPKTSLMALPRPHVLHILTHWMAEQEVSDLYLYIPEPPEAAPLCQFRVRGQLHVHAMSRASALALMALTGCPTTIAGIDAGYPARLSLFPHALRVQGTVLDEDGPVMMLIMRPSLLAMDETAQTQRDQEDPLLQVAFATLAAEALSESMPMGTPACSLADSSRPRL